MKKKLIKKLLVILMIISILATDFFVLGSNLIAYAVQANNIEFSVYFKDESGTQVKNINKSVKNENLELYAKIKVNEGSYLEAGATIELQNSDFNLISSDKGNVKGNKVTLKQIINAGETVEIKLNLEPQISEKMPVDMSLSTIVKLSGRYVNAENENGIEFDTTSDEVVVNYQIDESAQAELTTDIITNQVLEVNGTNKRIVQLLIKSRLEDNQYPVEKTTLKVNVPELSEKQPEEVNVLAIGKLATNGLTEISTDNWTNTDGILQIELNNAADANNEINWNRNCYDQLVVTFIYSEDVDATKVEITTNSEIKVHNSENSYTAQYLKEIENQELNNIIMANTQITTEELYKGNLYANIDTQYETTTTLVVTKANIVKDVTINETSDVFGTTDSKLTANTKYVTTEINKEKMLKILGDDGNITIKNGEETIVINKDTEVDESGNIVITYGNSTSELNITTSKPENAGVLEIKHTKILLSSSYTREQIRTITTLNTKDASIELKETMTKAELEILSEGDLSTTETNDIKLGITLVNYGQQYDLYKNPTITIELPTVVEKVEFKEEPKVMNNPNNVFGISSNINNNIVTIKLTGEQTTYPESLATQLYIPLELNVTLSELVATQIGKITMTYSNENATQYYGGAGFVEQQINIEGLNELVKWFNLESNENTSVTEDIKQLIKTEDVGNILNFEVTILNDKDTDMNNAKILGKLPTAGNDEETLVTTLKGIADSNATIYYTENSNATADTGDSTNGWTTDFLATAKLYLIELGTLSKGSNYSTTVKVQIPNSIENGLKAYTQYKVIYETDTNITEASRKITLETYVGPDLDVKLTGQVGQDILNNGDTVKEGEVIKYTATVTNHTNTTLENIQLKANVPEGTVVVVPVDEYEYTLDTYYEEKTDMSEISITDIKLVPEETYKIQYEVRVKTDITNGTEISNKIEVTYNDSITESEELKNKLEESNIRVTIKRANNESDNEEDKVNIQLIAGSYAKYNIIVENLSEQKIKDLKMKILTNTFVIEKLTKDTGDYVSLLGSEIPDEISIEEISGNGVVVYSITGKLKEDIENLDVSVIVTDSSNVKYRSNTEVEKIPYVDATIDLSSPQNNTYIKQEDVVEYKIAVKNTGEIKGLVKVEDIIPYYLEVQSITVDGIVKSQVIDETNTTTYVQSINNSVSHYMYLEPGQSAQIDIKTKVKYSPIEMKTITNKADVSIMGVYKATSTEVTHKLLSSETDELKNVISGFAWLDKNANGQQDEDESTFAGIKVKLVDKDGQINEVTTDNNGEYGFVKLLNGSYKITLEYDAENYELTTSLPEVIEIQDNTFEVNIGLKEVSKPEEDKPSTDDPSVDDPSGEENPPADDKPTEDPVVVVDRKSISGLAWLDSNVNGQKDNDEKCLSGIKVKIYDVSSKNYLKDENGNIIETTTDVNGAYKFENIEKGTYIILFEYNTEEYEPTIYLADGVDTTVNSKVVLKKISINGENKTIAVTDTINLQNSIANINIGLKEKLIFDLELNKYISRIVVQTSKETKTYNYEKSTFEKIEIHRKQVEGALVILEYTIEIKNAGEMSGYVRNIVDYLPSGLTFSSELNTDWYLSGSYLYTKSLENVQLDPGEGKEIKLILTRTMTDENLGLINNRAEIYEDYNKYGNIDIDSTPNNQVQGEDDIGSADVIILVSTGGSVAAYGILMMINVVLIGIAIRLMIKNSIIKLPNKKERR